MYLSYMLRNMSKQRSRKDPLLEDRTPTATTEYSKLQGKTVVEVKEILDVRCCYMVPLWMSFPS